MGESDSSQDDLSSDNSFGFVDNTSVNSVKHTSDPRYVDVVKEEQLIKKWVIAHNKIVETGDGNCAPILRKDVEKGLLKIYADASKKVRGKKDGLVVEVADNLFRARGVLSNVGDSFASFSNLGVGRLDGKTIIETADDDRVIGIPYTIANIGADKYYVVNGRVYSGWAMWFGLQAIRSPEDYAKNVDLTYNVPFVWAGFNLKAQLSLGASFDIVHGSDEDQSPEEIFLKDILYTKLDINLAKLTKTSFHLDMYGNSYWHIRRDNRGFPDKITILQPERIKVFLDPKTTKVLYYIYLPPVLAGMALTPYPNIREQPNMLHGPALTYPTPIILDPHDVLHFMENNYTEYPYGLSSCKAMIDPCTARMDINLIAPMIYKRYAKPFIHWRLDPMVPFQLTKGQIETYIDGMKGALESIEPMSDPVTTTRWSAMPIGAAQGKAELLTILQDLDNQMFSCIGVPESYFKPQGTGDRMIGEQDKTFMAAMQERQERVGQQLQRKLVKEIIDRYDRMISEQLTASGQEPLRVRRFDEYPELVWRETFKQDQVTTIQNTMALVQAGIIDKARAARRVGELPPQQSEDLARQIDLQRAMEEVQIQQASIQMLQLKLQEMQTMAVIQNGGVMPGEEGAPQEGESKGGGGKGEGSPGKKQMTPQEKKAKDYDENTMFRVTFTNARGKKQTEVMKGSTLKEKKAGGMSIQNITPVGTSNIENPAQSAAKAAGMG